VDRAARRQRNAGSTPHRRLRESFGADAYELRAAELTSHSAWREISPGVLAAVKSADGAPAVGARV